MANDTDPEDDTLHLVALGLPLYGNATYVNAGISGTLSYTPHLNFYGTDSFTYTVSDVWGSRTSATLTVNVTPVNDAPVAVNDIATTTVGVALTIPVLANDYAVETAVLSWVAIGPPLSGTATSTPPALTGTVIYTPAANFTGFDTFTYTARDGDGSTTTARVTITVLPNAVARPSTYIGDYIVFGTNSVWIRQWSHIHGGDIGVQTASPGPTLNSQAEVVIGKDTVFHDAASVIAGATVKLKLGTTVYAIFCNELQAERTATYGQVTAPISLPLGVTLPVMPDSAPGTTDYNVARGTTLTLPAGAYRDVTLRKNSTLLLTGGVYHFQNLDAGNQAAIRVTAATALRIAGTFVLGQAVICGPTISSTLNGTDIVVYVAGINAKNGQVINRAATIGHTNVVTATFYVPHSTLWLDQGTRAWGAFIGRDVRLGIAVEIWPQSAFATGDVQ